MNRQSRLGFTRPHWITRIEPSRRIWLLILIALFSLALLYLYNRVQGLWSYHRQPYNTSPVELPHRWGGNIVSEPDVELSGITYHPGRKTLFSISDEGQLSEWRTDGRLIRQELIRGEDFEGLTVDPTTGLLYAVIEGKDNILEISPTTFAPQREFSIDRDFEGRKLLKKGGMGLEAIAFIPDQAHPEGGTFWVGNQSFSLKPDRELSVGCQIEIPLKTEATSVSTGRIVQFFPLNIIDVSGIVYDQLRDCLLIMSDTTNLLLEIFQDGEIGRWFLLPGLDQEGIALDQKGFLYLAQENGQIIKVEDRRE